MNEILLSIKTQFDQYREKGISKESMEKFENQTFEELSRNWLIRVEIKKNKPEIQSFGQSHHIYRPRVTLTRYILEIFLEKLTVPEMVFYMCIRDEIPFPIYPDEQLNQIPIFTFSSRKKYHFEISPHILFPDVEIPIENHQNEFIQIYQESQKIKWEQKMEIAMWRGASTGVYIQSNETVDSILRFSRFQLVHLSKLNPLLLDAQFSLYTQFDDERMIPSFSQHFGKQNSSNKFDLLKSKYLLSVDGNGPTW